ncbi:MAG: glycosyltransferase [Sulfuricurvum sp.]|uniref:glycosyltransferase n=1 Tax=Sulfuricurvum sp. TaxID=2025608 RepID=UPI0025D84817|nr:glycosyltransferase [Sulfuricurvum sp.]MBV5321114.1 glycosyltransferase [Sulfuricurvum sp.]
MHINASIVLYNNPIFMIQKAIDSFLSTSYNVKLYLIDNSPTDILKILSSSDKRIVYIHNPSNPGFGAAHNLALNLSISQGVTYHLILNPDVYFDYGVLEKITEYMHVHEDVGLLMPKVLYPNGKTQYIARLLPTPWDLFARRFIPIKGYLNKLNRRYELTFFDYSSAVEIPFISGCFMFLRTNTIKETGGFDERFFMYLEDADLSRRIGTVSKTILYPDVSIYHEYQRGSHRSFKLLLIFIRSVFSYFNKYGWFFDPFRKNKNQQTLHQLGWRKT